MAQAAFDAGRAVVNAWIAANVPALGGKVVDLAADPLLANTTLSTSDGTHWNPTGNERAAQLIRDALPNPSPGFNAGSGVLDRIGLPAVTLAADVAAVKVDTGGVRADYTTGRAAQLDSVPGIKTQADKIGTDAVLPAFDGYAPSRWGKALLAFLRGKAAPTDNGDGTTTMNFKAADDATTALSTTYTRATGARAAGGTIP